MYQQNKSQKGNINFTTVVIVVQQYIQIFVGYYYGKYHQQTYNFCPGKGIEKIVYVLVNEIGPSAKHCGTP